MVKRKLSFRKKSLLEHYRNKAKIILAESQKKKSGRTIDYRELSKDINIAMSKERDKIIDELVKECKTKEKNPEFILDNILMIHYTYSVVLLETRNIVWPYEYMTFARRIGELWESFCLLCWQYTISKRNRIIQPLKFYEVKKTQVNEVEKFINKLSIKKNDKEELKKYYLAIWELVDSGEVNLKLDLHFKRNSRKYVIDFKSGFSSNEKGNTNRLLLVASIYSMTADNYRCLLLIRSPETTNNHYLTILQNSGLWEVYCSSDAYEQIKKLSEFDLRRWIDDNINWRSDFSRDMYQYISSNDLMEYLDW